MKPTCSLIIPTYRRPADLLRCLASVRAQRLPPTEVLVTVRPDDQATIDLLASMPDVRRIDVAVPGVVAAMNAGLAAATGDVIALTDDDGAPWTDWIERIHAYFSGDPRLGAVGGKDWQYKGDPLTLDDGVETRSGELQWWGRVIGQHHWAVAGPAREVSVVKGVNCAVRADALRAIGGFDGRLAGSGAQVHWELSLCLSLKRAGLKVIFDPTLGVDHFPAARFDDDQRWRFNHVAQRNAVANETLVLVEHLGGLRALAFLAWATLIGTRGAPGLLQVARLTLQREHHVIRRWWATSCGRIQGLILYVRSPSRR